MYLYLLTFDDLNIITMCHKYSEVVPNSLTIQQLNTLKINSKIFNPIKKIKQKLTVHVEAQVYKVQKKNRREEILKRYDKYDGFLIIGLTILR